MVFKTNQIFEMMTIVFSVIGSEWFLCEFRDRKLLIYK